MSYWGLEEQDKSSDIEQQPPFGDRKISNIQPQNRGVTKPTGTSYNFDKKIFDKKLKKKKSRHLFSSVHKFAIAGTDENGENWYMTNDKQFTVAKVADTALSTNQTKPKLVISRKLYKYAVWPEHGNEQKSIANDCLYNCSLMSN